MLLHQVQATKEFVWDMAHMLTNHPGQCNNLHGHTYKMEVTIAPEGLTILFPHESSTPRPDGMIMDFADLKKIVKKEIVDQIDHAYVYNELAVGELEHTIGRLLEAEGRKTFRTTYRSTAENMVSDFANRLEAILYANGVRLEAIKLWETPTSYAEWKSK